MPITALLHQNKLEDFKSWLDSIGHEHREVSAKWQVLQVKWGSGWQAIYQREKATEHLSVPQPLFPLVKRYLRERADPRPPAGYTAEELERDNPHNAWMRNVEI